MNSKRTNWSAGPQAGGSQAERSLGIEDVSVLGWGPARRRAPCPDTYHYWPVRPAAVKKGPGKMSG